MCILSHWTWSSFERIVGRQDDLSVSDEAEKMLVFENPKFQDENLVMLMI